MTSQAAQPSASSAQARLPSFSKGDVRVSLEFTSNEVHSLEPILMHVAVSNGTTNGLFLGLTQPFTDCEVSVIAKDGSGMPHTRYMTQLIRALSHAGSHAVLIKPGKTHSFTIPVNLLYDMSAPDIYTIQVRMSARRAADSRETWGDIRSDPAQVTVLSIDPLVESMWRNRR
jgi:hypothetical protein